jgi:medium-chain acyl-[acyl-carrier-protein] hydrolase
MKRTHPDSWLRYAATRADADEPTARVLCIPHAGAGASSFARWPELLPQWLELVCVQLPGREDHTGAPHVTCVGDAMERLLPEVARLGDRPLVIYGHCLGALLAFEVARGLRRRELPLPVAMFASGRRAPQQRSSLVLNSLPEQRLVEELEAMGASSPVLYNERWRRYYLQTMRFDMKISDEYEYRSEPPLECPLTYFCGSDDPRKYEEEGWSVHTARSYEVHTLAGGHFFTKDGTAEMVDWIAEATARVLSLGSASFRGGASLRSNDAGRVVG